jgi:tRNA nucleotidyltransferase/poly(A) polymerase
VNPEQRAALDDLLRRPALARVLAALDGAGEETRLVGGAVRNTLLGRPVSDLDLTTTALPAETIRRAKAAGLKAVPTGIEHGTITVVTEGTPFEVTTLREDVETDGRHAVVRFGRSFEADARRRDFTINALSLDAGGWVHDTVGGLADLEGRRVRFIGEPRQRIREDYLRILRFFRFHAEYADGLLDAEGLAAAIAERDGLAILSAERIRTELLKLLGARRGLDAVASLSESGLLQRLVGGVAELGRYARAALFQPERPDPILRLGALLVATPEDALRLRERLRLSNAEWERLDRYAKVVARLRSAEEALDAAELRRLAVAFGATPLVEGLAILAGEAIPQLSAEGDEQRRLYAAGAEAAPVFPLTGRDLVRRGMTPGPEIGRLLAEIRQAWLDAGCPPGWRGLPDEHP